MPTFCKGCSQPIQPGIRHTCIADERGPVPYRPVTVDELIAVLNDAHVHSPAPLGLEEMAKAILTKFEVRRKEVTREIELHTITEGERVREKARAEKAETRLSLAEKVVETARRWKERKGHSADHDCDLCNALRAYEGGK